MKYPLRVVSVERSLFEGDVEFIIANGADGELGVLARHAPLMTILKPGPLRIQEVFGGPEQVLFVWRWRRRGFASRECAAARRPGLQ